MILTAAFYNKMATDSELIAMLAEYGGQPAVFTTDPVPGDADLPYIVTAGEVSRTPFDTKNKQGEVAIRDIRCYAAADGIAELIELIAERVRELFHRQALVITGYDHMISSCNGPIVADADEVYGRVISVSVTAQEN